MFAKLRNFLVESQEELKKVQWPTRREAVYLTIMVILVSALLAVFLGGIDYIFTYLIQLFITPN